MKTLGILWDYNGVIVNDEHLQERAVVETLAGYGVGLSHDMYKEYCLGRSDRAGFENLKQIFPALHDVSVADFTQEKTGLYMPLTKTESILWPGITDVFQSLSREFAMAIVTGSREEEIFPILDTENLRGYFDAIITANDITFSKPNPEGYLKGIEALGLPAKNIAVIEDTSSGIAAGKAAGLLSIAVLHSLPADRLQEADMILDSIKELTPELLKECMPDKNK